MTDDPTLRPIRSYEEYLAAVELLNALLDAGGADEAHKLAPLVDRLGTQIGDYEGAHPVDHPQVKI